MSLKLVSGIIFSEISNHKHVTIHYVISFLYNNIVIEAHNTSLSEWK